MSWQGRNATLTIGDIDIGFVKSISMSEEEMKCDNVEFKPILNKTITFTGWVVRPKILKSKGRQPRFVRVVRK